MLAKHTHYFPSLATKEAEDPVTGNADKVLISREEQESPPCKVPRYDDTTDMLDNDEEQAAGIAHEKLTTNDASSQDSASPYFIRPSASQLLSFLRQHPLQPTEGIAFNHTIAYSRTSLHGDQVPRKWVSYSKDHDSLMYFICLAFYKTMKVPLSVTVSDRKHVLHV